MTPIIKLTNTSQIPNRTMVIFVNLTRQQNILMYLIIFGSLKKSVSKQRHFSLVPGRTWYICLSQQYNHPQHTFPRLVSESPNPVASCFLRAIQTELLSVTWAFHAFSHSLALTHAVLTVCNTLFFPLCLNDSFLFFTPHIKSLSPGSLPRPFTLG